MASTLIDRLFETPQEKKLLQRETAIMEVTEFICAVMEEDGVSRAELARRLGTSPANVSQVLDGERNMTISTISDIFFHLNREIKVSAELLEPVWHEGDQQAFDVVRGFRGSSPIVFTEYQELHSPDLKGPGNSNQHLGMVG